MVEKYFPEIKIQESKWKGILAIIISVLISQIIFVGNANASPLVHRIAGYTQYETAAAIANEGWSQSDYAILAYGENFPDALAAAPLARKYNAPILLTEAQNLTPITKQTVQALKVKNVVIVGGNVVVSSTVANQLQDMGVNVTRLAGNDKYDTAIEIAKQLGAVNEISVVTGDDYADALSISSVTALSNSPIILVPKDYLTESIKSYLSSNTLTHTFIIGNSEQINESVAKQFPNVERISGNDKYARNVAVLKRFDTSFDFNNIFLATGDGYADALAGSAYAASKTAPILLIGNSYNNDTASFLNSKNNLKQLNVLGGEVVMPSTLIQKYTNSLSGISPGGSYSPSEIAKLVSPSVVYIEVSNSYGIPIASGSGFIIDSTGKIATNYHLIKGAYSAKVKTYDGKIYDVSKVYAYDPTQDMALLKIDATGLQPVVLGDSDKVNTGDKIYTIGNPSGLDNTMSDGLISTKSKVVDGASYIQISAPISSGSSGGVLLNEQVEVIGITTAGVNDGQNLNFAIPINLLKLKLTQNIDLTLAQLPRGTVPSSQLTIKTDQEFVDLVLNVKYKVMIIAGKTINFSWKVNDYKTGVSKVSIHGKIVNTDYGSWMNLLSTNQRGEIMLYFAQLNNDIALNYPGETFMGSILYEDYYKILPSPSFPYDEVSYSGDGRWFVSHPLVSFFDLYSMGKSDPRVTISD